ncbi:hypothetical protein [Alterisphingorhabdus coralli]|uniref:DNA-directed DNA polymerase n=1 Tax=Alterisphingorhabdus coralli TaxID=3071408 RepID=A0AA97I2L2_9SPHN|nr:hypothetical protein [Parasphingorhabdus sp. SCSIO 66989]WOE76368.1 hypothetical protein RB602_06545 [Parasphingorhabdus sp. SCSIO 66989]
MKRQVANDIEIYENYLLIAFQDVADGEIVTFEKRVCPQTSDVTGNFDDERIHRIISSCQIITFNGMAFDVPLIYYALGGATVGSIKRAANRIIHEGLKWWNVAKELNIYIPQIDHIDLIEPNPAVMQGLKVLNGRLHGPKMQDLPYPPDAVLTDEQMDKVRDYCGNDLDATVRLFRALEEPIKMREEIAARYGLPDMRSKSDAQMGEAIIKNRVEDTLGRRVQKDAVTSGTTFSYQVPDFIRFETPLMQKLLDDVRHTVFRVNANGRVIMPKSLDGRYIELGASTYKMGIGGLHSTEANRAVHSTEDHVLIDADVASQYPSIILKLGLAPKALGNAFLDAYKAIYDERRAAKKAGDKVRDKGGKIALNGCYGKLGSKYSVLHAPHLMIAVTLTGQLSLLMLIEKAEQAGITVVSGNTDGVVFRLARSDHEGLDHDRLIGGKLKEITDWWENLTGFDLEFAEYKAIYNLSVNTYFAIKADGGVKRKGTLSNPWEEGDLRAQMMKNPNMTICSDAALKFITDGVDPAETIRTSDDVRGFVTVVNVKGGGKWREEPIGKVVRYAWCLDGDPIYYCDPHPTTGNFKKVSRTDSSRPLMNLPDRVPDDIDYERYIAEAWDILESVGAVHRFGQTMPQLGFLLAGWDLP